MVNQRIISARPLFRVAPEAVTGALIVGLCCAACETQIHDLDQTAPYSTDQGHIVRFTSAEDRLYWFEEYAGRSADGSSEYAGHRLVGCEKRDCKATRQQYAKQQRTTQEPPAPSIPCLTVRGNTAYWTYGTEAEPADGELQGVAYANGSVVSPHETLWHFDTQRPTLKPTPLFEYPVGWHCTNVTADENAFYCAGKSGDVLAHALDSDPYPRVVVTDQVVGTSPSQFIAYGDYLYWARASGGIRRIRKDGTPPVEVLEYLTSVASLAVDDNYLYWTDNVAGAVRRCSPANCAGTTITLATADADPAGTPEPRSGIYALLVLGESLYWLQGVEGQPSVLRRCTIDGCAGGAEPVNAASMVFYAVDKTGLYGVFATPDLEADDSIQFEVKRSDEVSR